MAMSAKIKEQMSAGSEDGKDPHHNILGVAAKEIFQTAGRMNDCFLESGCGKLSSKEKICPKSHFVLQYCLF